jgi:predicted phosphoribosyltransferase
LDALRIPLDYIEKEKERQIAEIKRRTAIYRRQDKRYSINGKHAILIDDGIATGATIIASARWVRKNSPSSAVVVAVPVAPPQSIELLEQEVNSVIALYAPADFGAVGQFYERFNPVSDEEVIKIMRARGLL